MSGVVTAVTSVIVGAVVSIVKEVTESELLTLLEESVTLIVQSLNVPSDRAANVIELLPADAEVVELLQLPP